MVLLLAYRNTYDELLPLKVYDGWTTNNRYIDYEKITMIKNITKVIE